MEPRTLDAAALLAHTGFLGRLASGLVADGNDADDAVQETWLKALRAGSPARGPGAFLATVLRNVVRDRHRVEQRRRAREEAAARPIQVPSVTDVLQRENLRQQVVQAVLALDEPYRTVILLRYYEGLEPSVIGRHLGVPGATVRSRLHRALARLRGALDRTHGDRRWLSSLLPLAGRARRAVFTSSAGILMKKLVVAAAALAILLVGFLFTTAGAVDRPDAEAPAAALSSGRPADSTAMPDRIEVPIAGGPVPGAHEDRPVFHATRSRGELRLRASLLTLCDGVTRLCTDTAFEVSSTPGPLPSGFSLGDDRNILVTASTDAAGVLRLENLPTGPYRILPRDLEVYAARIVWVTDDRAVTAEEVLFQATGRIGHTWVRVVEADERPITGATAELRGQDQWGTPLPLESKTTDRSGWARLRAVQSGTVHVHAPDGREAWAPVVASGGELTPPTIVRVVATGSLRGLVVGAHRAARAGTKVAVRPRWDLAPRYTAPIVDGSYSFARLPPGMYAVELESPSGLRLALPPIVRDGRPVPDTVEESTVAVEADRTTMRDFSVEPGGAIRGNVQARDGAPIAGAQVYLHLQQPAGNTQRDDAVYEGRLCLHLSEDERGKRSRPAVARALRTDAGGAYHATGLHRGAYWVEVITARLTHDVRVGVMARPGTITELEHVLEPAGVLQCTLGEPMSWELRRHGEAGPTTYASDGDFTVPGLAPGPYEIVRREGRSGPVAVLTSFSIEAGRTTCLDLRGRGPALLAGRVVGANGPVGGALVQSGSLTATTVADGSFQFRRWKPHEGCLQVRAGSLGFTYRIPELARGGWTWVGDVRLGPHTLVVRTLSEDGQPIAAHLVIDSRQLDGASTSTVPREPYAEGTGTYVVMADGEARLDHLWPGVYDLRATLPDGHILYRSAPKSGVRVPDEQVVELRARPCGRLVIEVRDVHGDPAPCVVVMVKGTDHRGVTDAHGAVTIGGVPAGKVTVEAFRYGHWLLGRREKPQSAHHVQSFELSPNETRRLRFVY